MRTRFSYMLVFLTHFRFLVTTRFTNTMRRRGFENISKEDENAFYEMNHNFIVRTFIVLAEYELSIVG